MLREALVSAHFSDLSRTRKVLLQQLYLFMLDRFDATVHLSVYCANRVLLRGQLRSAVNGITHAVPQVIEQRLRVLHGKDTRLCVSICTSVQLRLNRG